MDESERQRLLDDANAIVNEHLQAFATEKAGLEERTKLLEERLEQARTELLEARSRRAVESPGPDPISDTAMLQVEERLRRIIERTLHQGRISDHLEEGIRASINRLLADEHGRIQKHLQDSQNEQIIILEKKIRRMAQSLEQAEADRGRAWRRAQALEAACSFPLRPRPTSSLLGDPPDKERRLALMEEIFKFNQEIRRELAAAGKLRVGARGHSKKRPLESASS